MLVPGYVSEDEVRRIAAFIAEVNPDIARTLIIGVGKIGFGADRIYVWRTVVIGKQSSNIRCVVFVDVIDPIHVAIQIADIDAI